MRSLFLALLLLTTPVMAQDALPEFTDGVVYVEPTVDQDDSKVMAARLSKCGAYMESVSGDVANFPQAAYKLLTGFAYIDALTADTLVMDAYQAQKDALGTADDTQIASLKQECDNLANFKDEIIEMEREIYE